MGVGPNSTRGIRARKLAEARERNAAWRASLTEEERTQLDAVYAPLVAQMAAISSRGLPRRQRTRAIVRYAQRPQERVDLWQPFKRGR